MSYSLIGDHRAMVFDARCAGLGVHGLHAARFGAARVLLVEPEPVIEVARTECARPMVAARMTGEVAVGNLAVAMRDQFPAVFTTEADALRFAKNLAEHYS